MVTASLLDTSTDRIAIYSTACHCWQKIKKPCQFHSLASPRIEMIKEDVSKLRRTSPIPAPINLRTMFRSILEFLSQPRDTSYGIHRNRRRSLALLISPYASECVDSAASFGLAPTFLIIPGASQSPDTIMDNVWPLPQPTSVREDHSSLDVETKTSLIHGLRSVITRTRGNCHVPMFRNIELHIETQPPCTIEQIQISPKANLFPGQIISCLIQVGIPASQDSKDGLTAEKENRGLQTAIHDLEDALGLIQTECFSLKVLYEHPFLPSGSKVVVHRKVKIPRPRSSSYWSQSAPQIPNRNGQAYLQKRLASFLACHHTPEHALALLDIFFPPGSKGDAGTIRTIRSIRHELLEQQHFQSLRSQDLLESTSNDSLVHPSPAPGQLLNRPLSTDDADATTADLKPRCLRPRSLSDPSLLAPEPAAASSDHAHLIWRHMRQTSRSSGPRIVPGARTPAGHTPVSPPTSRAPSARTPPLASSARSDALATSSADGDSGAAAKETGAGGTGESGAESEGETVRRLRATALRNKRSVGADTLRSLAMAARAGAREASWLEAETDSSDGEVGSWI
jgi:hypothetical protein